MKKQSLLLLTLFMGTATANPERVERIGLDLTEEQKAQMHQIKQAESERLQTARAEIRAQSRVEMAEFLTTEQLEKLDQIEAHRSEHTQMRHEHKQMKRHTKKMRTK